MPYEDDIAAETLHIINSDTSMPTSVWLKPVEVNVSGALLRARFLPERGLRHVAHLQDYSSSPMPLREHLV